MTPTIEILERVNRNSQKNKDEVFTKLYRYMLRPDIYYVAYKNLYANSGASTRGVDNDTADGFAGWVSVKIRERQLLNLLKGSRPEIPYYLIGNFIVHGLHNPLKQSS